MKNYFLIASFFTLSITLTQAQTTNYSGKFNSSGTPVNSNVVDNNGSVAIGATDPTRVHPSSTFFPGVKPLFEV